MVIKNNDYHPMNKGFYIASQILRRPWAIDFRFAEAHKHIPNMLFSGLSFDTREDLKHDKRSIPFLIQDARKPYTQSYIDFSDASEGSIAVIPVIGPLMKFDVEDCGMVTVGMSSLGRAIQDADENPNISSIILYMDTPGGTVDGTQSLADIVAKTSKPVVTFVDGLMASAGMWIGSQSDYIIAENTTTEIGSIGVCYSFFDNLKQLEAEGTTFHYIVPDESADKNATFMAALKGEYGPIIESELRPLVNMFRDEVNTGRNGVETSAMTGKVFFAFEALQHNLIDEIGNFQRAVDKASELATNQKQKLFQNSKKNMKTFTKLSAILALSEILQVEDTSASTAFTVEQIEAIESALISGEADLSLLQQRLAETETERDNLTAQVTTIQADLDTATSRVAEVEGQIVTQAARIAELEQDPPAVVVTTTTDNEDKVNDNVSSDPDAQKIFKTFQAISGAK
ncbi:S49 family peptidase [Massilibacteroides sp.]|uniref:S49 family peptidase n=1 Tax=Massilibacteroides sp. TaxID=2034766 RepID=UPI002609C505|nr:S49 family peptidase [Massilibacteroides sp.]